MRLLVCGGRDYSDKDRAFAVLDRFRAKFGCAAVIHGAARGADSLAGAWARARGVPEIAEPADWKTHGKRAGPIRNQAMLDKHAPAAVIAFPGGVGTADMVRRSRAAGLTVYELAR